MTALCHGGFPQCWGSVLRAGRFWGKPFSSWGLAAFLSVPGVPPRHGSLTCSTAGCFWVTSAPADARGCHCRWHLVTASELGLSTPTLHKERL